MVGDEDLAGVLRGGDHRCLRVLKAYWVLGGTALWEIAPLSQSMIEKARSHTAPGWFVIADAVTVVLAVAGVLFALATVRPRRWLPVWLVGCRCGRWPR